MLRRLFYILLLLFTPVIVSAQSAATLLADSVVVSGNSTLIASGNVEVLYGDTRLQAGGVIYDQTTDQLTIQGPIILREGDEFVILAESAGLDPTLQNGILRSARLVLNQQVQLAAAEINLIDGRYNQLTKIAATSCHVCNGRPPLWQIRASRVVHDTLEKQIYFDNATLQVMDVPIFWLPRIRIPDPSLDRATGFMIPRVRFNSRLDTGIKIPYFIRLGDYRDLTLTPYWSSKTLTLEGRYRQNFKTGSIQINGAYTNDDILPADRRGYLFADGQFDLKDDYKLTFDIETTSDNAYLLDYGYSSKDRLDSAITLSRIHSDSYFSGGIVNYNTLRDAEDDSTQPTFVGDVVLERRLYPENLGGELNIKTDFHSHYRSSDINGDDGRDVARIGVQAAWINDWVLSNGMIFETNNQLNLDYFNVQQDTAFAQNATSALPTLSASLRWPLVKHTGHGVTQTLEPIAQLIWSEDFGDPIPNEQSTRVEFDEGNLFALSKFPATDQRESGLRANLGVSWSRYDPNGWQSTFTMGRTLASETNLNFTDSSGLSGLQSDWLVSGQIKWDNGLDLVARALLDDSFSMTKTETRLGWNKNKVNLSASYVYIIEDAAEDRTTPVNELTVNGGYEINENWTTTAGVRYNFVENQAASASLGFKYEHECVEIDFSASRRFTSSTSIEPTTDFDLSIGLTGFTANAGGKKFARRCSN